MFYIIFTRAFRHRYVLHIIHPHLLLRYLISTHTFYSPTPPGYSVSPTPFVVLFAFLPTPFRESFNLLPHYLVCKAFFLSLYNVGYLLFSLFHP
ncbi:hypothetical protein L873DRAFT_1066607 [Choiromyces venosus 120613-1]|uniref:Uncharacterized protein n=1 Tax=Choiromyces venosus 120613-1 TaxID=1336337 RepID=A0A3N4JIF8_9PEZI|nr:hypothetical protein L873DRAFT_1066607 [Choiromyces venosus 120613-1]